MAKTLKVTFPKRCIGCELCVMGIQRQLKTIGLEGSLIRIFRSQDPAQENTFVVDLDPQINTYDIKKIMAICPTAVFTIEEGETNELVS